MILQVQQNEMLSAESASGISGILDSNSAVTLRFTPIAAPPAPTDGKLSAPTSQNKKLQRPSASTSLWSTAVFGLAFISLALHPAQKNAQCGTHNLGKPQAHQPLQSINYPLVAGSESNSSWPRSSLLQSSSLSPVQTSFDFPDSPRSRTDSGAQPLSKTIANSDSGKRETVVGDFPPTPSPKTKYARFEWLLEPKTRITLHERIMARLIQAEAHESDPWLRQDYRQAWICVSLAERGNTEPFLVSSYQVYGTHPAKVWPKIQANRQAKLGKELRDWYDAAGNLKPDLPKKPSSPTPPSQEAVERATKERLAALLNFPLKEGA